MTTSDPSLQNTRKTLQRADHSGEAGIRSVSWPRPEPCNTVQELELFLDDLCRSRERLLVLSFGASENGAKDALVHGQHAVGQGGACLREQCP